ncbi:MAG: DUF177 domain-containing protein [Actinobacteria bacterium]|nr:DUF177 domain-containing protein [Actinomycetota bacterium]
MQGQPFLLNLTALKASRSSVRREVRRGSVAGISLPYSCVPEASEITAEVTLELVHAGIMVRGTLRARWEGECRRCLGMAYGDLIVSTSELFVQRAFSPPPKLKSGVVANLSREDGLDGPFTYMGDELDLVPMIRESLLLELPSLPLCRQDCPGLCPMCGHDLSDGQCGCTTMTQDPRWSALDALKAPAKDVN